MNLDSCISIKDIFLKVYGDYSLTSPAMTVAWVRVRIMLTNRNIAELIDN